MAVITSNVVTSNNMDDLFSTIRDYEFTRKANRRLDLIEDSFQFYDMDSDMIYKYLTENNDILLTFKDFLKRYVCEKAGLEERYSEVSDSEYQAIIKESFDETGTPKSMKETTKKWGAVIKGWLTQDVVKRDTVFLIGFGLRMKSEEVSEFLVKAIREENFNFNKPDECVYWHCYENGYGFHMAKSILEEYDSMELSTKEPEDSFEIFTDEGLMKHLAYLKVHGEQLRENQKARNVFLKIVQDAKEEIAVIKTRDDSARKFYRAEDITSGDIERIMTAGIPRDKGELKKIKDSNLEKVFRKQRITQNKLDEIIKKGRTPERFEIISLSFLVEAMRADRVDPGQKKIHHDPEEVARNFIEKTNAYLRECSMQDIYVVDPYDAFLTLCIATYGPLEVYSEVWGRSYNEQNELS